MINRIRVATQEEAKTFAETHDGRGGTLLALDVPEGTMYAVVRTVVEVDPVVYPENASTRMKAMFHRDIETVLAAQGVTQYYFNTHVTNTEFQEFSKHWGAQQISKEPELRFIRNL